MPFLNFDFFLLLLSMASVDLMKLFGNCYRKVGLAADVLRLKQPSLLETTITVMIDTVIEKYIGQLMFKV